MSIWFAIQSIICRFPVRIQPLLEVTCQTLSDLFFVANDDMCSGGNKAIGMQLIS